MSVHRRMRMSSGTAPTGAGPVESLQNKVGAVPEDMRIRLCTDKAAAYEASRDALYPMGLPGQETYLKDRIAEQVHTIKTWVDETVKDVPLPKPRPS